MNSTRRNRRLFAAMLLALLCAVSFPAAAEEPSESPSDWQTVEYGGLALSLPPDWVLGDGMFGMRAAHSNASGEELGATIVLSTSPLNVERAVWDEASYLADIGDGFVYVDARIEDFVTDPIDGWPAIRTMLTAEDSEDETIRFFLIEAIVATGAQEGVRITCMCDVRIRDQWEETFARIIASIRKPGTTEPIRQQPLAAPAAKAEDVPSVPDGFLTAREMLARDEMAPFVELRGDEIPSIYTVVGRRTITEAEGSLDANGGLHERRAYQSESVFDDLYAYGEYLTANGWEELRGPTGIVHGEIAFAKPSADDKLTLTVVLSYDGDGYLFTATLQEGVAWHPSGWTPRKTALISPPGLGAPRPLTGEGVPAAYTEASMLAMRDGRMAYVPFSAESNVYEAQVGSDWDWDTTEYYTYDRVRGILLQENGIVCLLDESDVKLAICEPFEEPKYVLPELSDELPEEELVSINGPLMQLADGTLLFLDRTGSLYVCGTDGSALRAIPGVRADDFVYYGGFVYFTNLNDQMTHRNVYDAVAYEYSDFSYPRLYRVALDGTGLTRLTDCGVRGLTAQGPYILYQNLDEPYTLPEFELSGKNILHGPLYCYDADVGKHRALDIESDAYLPTPWGLAVWYHDFSIEPYDIEAKLVLHGYDGMPLYKLDAGTAEFTGASCVYENTLCFYAFDWPYYWEEGRESAIFSVVPLDGRPCGEITSLRKG